MLKTISGALLGAAIIATFTMPAQAGFKTLVTLDGSNGSDPAGSLIQGSDGYIYGTTDYGGASNKGVIYRMTLGGKYKVIHDFCSQTKCTDGATGEWLMQAADGDFYGQTLAGGNATNQGTIFKITRSGKFTTLYSYCSQTNCTDGAYPVSPLVQASDGSFWGTTGEGGANNSGTIFKFVPGNAPQIIYSFCSQSECSDGAYPFSGLVLASDGNFYGETAEGGNNRTTCPLHNDGCGTIFRITPSGSFSILYTFCTQTNCPDGQIPQGQLIQAKDGDIYGTTDGGGAVLFNEPGVGTVFKISLSGTLTTLYEFCSTGTCSDGEIPYSGVIQASDGNFYGGTALGGPEGWGSLYRLTPNGKFAVMYSVNETDGQDIFGSPMQASNGLLYGATAQGGNTSCNGGCGVIFRGRVKH